MKNLIKIISFILILPLMLAATTPTLTVSDVLKNSKNYDTVVIEGTLTQQIDDDEFVFSDNTGKIKVEFDDDVFGRNPVQLNTKVKIMALVKTSKIRDSELKATKFKYLETPNQPGQEDF